MPSSRDRRGAEQPHRHIVSSSAAGISTKASGCVSSPAVANRVVYAGRNIGEVLTWKAAAANDEIVSSSPSVVNGKVYVGSADKNAPENISGRL
ncbi:MAG TPA: PQQ-binding-like beta-propeller repeat protein [Candidatus Cybelea sp.]|jgi:hypothetical protein|nr:PQQ-binding-like beta-propeller repeat protein [Candidatus Cybelea sp.]